MSGTGLETLDHSIQLTHEWVNELDEALGWQNRHRSFRLLRAVLQTLRDRLPQAQAALFFAQIPLVLRGVFFEHWQPVAECSPHGNLDRIFIAVQTHFLDDPLEEAGEAVSEVFRLFENRLSAGVVGHVEACLPGGIRALWSVEGVGI